ncbi:hypothetical protein HYALB_00013696 [Hymenoscyphus albidus]|uniref:Uncharacterized protein n=1 Tax=Hymenoscyphus albidus TaxID=595503 RepID=A0A9N9QB17_9HELO|nr:hypothetical protein HYALB_00013696 [Hymenoscyphus albidus]
MSPPAEDIKKAPLMWEMLKSMPPEERTSSINRRFRTFDVLYLRYPEISQEGAEYIDQKRKERKKEVEMAWGEYDVRESDNVTWSVEAVQEMYPLRERENKILM